MRFVGPAVFLLITLLDAGSASGQPNPPAAPGKPLAFTFERQAVSIANITPKGTVVVFGLGKEYEAFYLTRHMWKETLVDEDGDGTVRLSLETGVPGESVWVAVDLASGQSASVGTGTGAGGLLLTPNLRARRQGADIRVLRDFRKQGYAILVKDLPSATPVAMGVWFLGAGDGNPRDADGVEDGAIEFDLANAEPLGATTPAEVPGGIGGNDRVYIVDPDSLEHYSASLASLGSIAD